MRRLTAIGLALFVSTAGAADKKTAPPAELLAARGLPYSLPKTILNVELTVTKTVKTPGQFCGFADLFVPDNDLNAPCGDKTVTKTAVKGFAVTGVGVPDPNKTYLLPAASKGGWAIDTAGGVELSERGLLNSLDDERTNRRVEVVTGFIKAAAGIFARSIGAAAPETTKLRDTDEDRFRKTFLADWQLIWNFDRLKAKDFNRASRLVSLWKSTDSGLMAARAAYAEISDLSGIYRGLLTGQGAVSATALITEVKKEMDSRRNVYFLGTVDSATWSPTFEVDPGLEPTPIPLVFVNECGAKPAPQAKLIKNPIGGDVKCEDAAIPISLRLVKAFRPILNIGTIDSCVESDTKVLKGIPFVVPADVAATLDGTSLPEAQLQISQWGKTSCLTVPGNSYTVNVSYYANTGAIKSAKFTDKSLLTADAVNALSGVAGDVQTALSTAAKTAEANASAAAAAEANADLAALKAERERLDEKVRIQNACAALNIKCEI